MRLWEAWFDMICSVSMSTCAAHAVLKTQTMERQEDVTDGSSLIERRLYNRTYRNITEQVSITAKYKVYPKFRQLRTLPVKRGFIRI